MNIGNMAKGMNGVCRFDCGEGVSIVPSGRYVLFDKYAELEELFNTATDWAEELATEKQGLQQQLAAAREELASQRLATAEQSFKYLEEVAYAEKQWNRATVAFRALRECREFLMDMHIFPPETVVEMSFKLMEKMDAVLLRIERAALATLQRDRQP